MFSDVITNVIFWTTAGVLIIQLLYILGVFSRILGYKQKNYETVEDYPAISVIIAARNQANELQTLIPKLFEQNHPDFEIVVVNDRSWDHSKDVLEALKAQYEDLHVIEIEENRFNQRNGKKFAITLGIKGAGNDLLIFTDADCRPVSTSWLRHMSMGYADGNQLVLGYSPEVNGKGLTGFLSKIDASVTGMQYLSFALAGIPYMGVGRNMGYSSELFFETGGFKTHYKIQGGDDDLFVNQAVKYEKPSVVVHPDSFVLTDAATNLGVWWRRKRRHYSTSSHYRVIHKLLLITYPLTMLLWLTGSILLAFHTETMFWGLGLLATRLISASLVFGMIFKKLKAGNLGWIYPLAEPFWVLLTGIIHLSNRIAKPKVWK